VTCHCVEALALAVWVGGLVSIIAAVIPAVFTTIGMETGGRMLTRTFQGYDRLVLVAAGLIVAGTLARVFLSGSWREQIGMIELALLATMVVIAVTLALWLTPETARLQALAFSATDDAKRAAYDNFFAYHRAARALYIINLGLGVALLCVKVKKWVR
jgi:hypothetical protein